MSNDNTQKPIAVVGLACRLPGNCRSPSELWNFLLDGKIADTNLPSSRFNLKGHYDGTLRPWTMRSPGGMYIDTDPKDLDAAFFGLSQVDAISMDPQQRQLLEVVYEALENAGLSLEKLRAKAFGCFVGSYASDYDDMQSRDPEDKTPSFTVGTGRAMLSNRISHFLDIRGPSITIDTACSGSLISVDLACRYLDSGDADGAIVAGCNMYLSPEHNMDQHAMASAASPSGRCWTFDARADGYIKAEAVNALILKRLDDAVRDGDPIRAIIRGTSTNSDGRTPGIASPSAEAQASAIRKAYARAGIHDLNETAYLECHGTGTLAGDPVETKAAATVFSKSRSSDAPLLVGSVKSNIGHSEPAAGISGVIKTVLAIENATIPGNPTFEIPNPNIDFEANNLRPFKNAVAWPRQAVKRASVNSFGYGGSNAHAIIEHPHVLLPELDSRSVSSYARPNMDIFADEDEDCIRRLLVFSANNEASLKSYIKKIARHLTDPRVSIKSGDLAYTLSERRTRHFHRAYCISTGASMRESDVVYIKPRTTPRLGFVFTGQGAQWPQMGRELIRGFPVAKQMIHVLDNALQAMPDPPYWKLIDELTSVRSSEHLRLPEFSQPLVTALQLALLAVLQNWGLEPVAVVGHSSGEIAAAVAAQKLSPEMAIVVAFLRGRAAKDVAGPENQESRHTGLGMLAVGVGPDVVQQYIQNYPRVRIACRNSPSSVTLAGEISDLQNIENLHKADGHFARLLQVNLAYHSGYMGSIAEHYGQLLKGHHVMKGSNIDAGKAHMYSTVFGALLDTQCDSDYWVDNMISPVQFDQAVSAMIKTEGVDFLIELGPSGALSAPINQIKQSLGGSAMLIDYAPTLSRDSDSTRALYDLAGKMFVLGAEVNMTKVNKIATKPVPRIITDLPNYEWDHSVKYWHESLASKDWRYRYFPVHDLLGTKVLGTSWSMPTWKRILRLKHLPWIRDHRLGADIVFPASGYIAMAVEAVFQTHVITSKSEIEDTNREARVTDFSYRLRDVRFLRALALDENQDYFLYLFLAKVPNQGEAWYNFRIAILHNNNWADHCQGLIQVTNSVAEDWLSSTTMDNPTPAQFWYKAMKNVGFNFGPRFQNLVEINSVPGQRTNWAKIACPDLDQISKESSYAVHPSLFDSFFQAGIPSLYNGHRTLIEQALVPRLIDEIHINSPLKATTSVIAKASATFSQGREDKIHNYLSNISIYTERPGNLLARVIGLHYTELPTAEASNASQNFLKSIWKPDISLLQNVTISDVAMRDARSVTLSHMLQLPQAAAFLVSLLEHKLPFASVVDFDITTNGFEMRNGIVTEPQAMSPQFERYVSVHSTPDTMRNAQQRLGDVPSIEFYLYDYRYSEGAPFDTGTKFNLVILRTTTAEAHTLSLALEAKLNLLTENGLLILVYCGDVAAHPEFESSFMSAGLELLFSSPSVFLCRVAKKGPCRNGVGLTADIVKLSKDSDAFATFVRRLRTLGWHGNVLDMTNASSASHNTPLLLLDDPEAPFLANVSESDFEKLKEIKMSYNSLLWITFGSQMRISRPTNALVHGFTRTIRAEDPTLTLKTLDVSSYSSLDSARAVLVILDTLLDTNSGELHQAEHEYCEVAGLLYVSRVLPDQAMLKADDEFRNGIAPKLGWLKNNQKFVRLYCERTGDLASLHFNEVNDQQCSPSLERNEVEVEILAAGLNYKDIATCLGIVPENEFALGLEGAGIVKQVGDDVKTYRAGNRVVVHGKGCFANRIRVPKECLFKLPSSITFEQGATMSVVYFTAVYGLMELARIKRGQSVLIHSAAGGVGLASIQICKHLRATIYATAGSPEKRRFLQDNHGIPAEHIFSSRDTNFVAGIRKITGGRGVDCVINSLTGALLDESWRILADGGTFLEIGKKDITDRNRLSMEPFDRNCTYRGIDISHPSILKNLPLVERVLQKIRSLLFKGHIKPIFPLQIFSFDQIPDAIRHMRPGIHMGKIVISHGLERDIKVSIRPAPLTMKLDASSTYLIIGGLKGLCGSIALYLARCGAQHLTIVSRNGANDERSQQVIRNLNELGTKTTIAKGDISCFNDVCRIFDDSLLPIDGVIQGAMVLRDRTFESMTHLEYHETLSCKLQGTWNLHLAEERAARKFSFFSLLSSISGVIGSVSQANYAAGNAFQDAFAAWRCGNGLVAHAIDLGIIEDVGYMSNHKELTKRVQSRVQLPGIHERQLHDAIRLSILHQQTKNARIEGVKQEGSEVAQMITGLPFSLPANSSLAMDMRFRGLRTRQLAREGENGRSKNDSLQAFQAMLSASLPTEALIPEACKLINAQFVRVLGLPADIEETKPLSGYGLDSLAAVDLRNWVKVSLQVELTTLEILNAGSLRALCEKLVGRLKIQN